MAKAGSGFIRAAGSVANSIQSGSAGSWRLGNPGDYTKDIVDIFRRTYQNKRGIHFDRNSRGEIVVKHVSQTALNRIYDVAAKIAKDVQVYNETAAREYSRMREVWGKPVRVSSKDMDKVRSGIQSGDTMLINPRGGRNDSDALAHAQNAKWQTEQNTNVGVLLEANRMMNAMRNAKWTSAADAGKLEEMTADIFQNMLKGYARAESAAYRGRRKK